MKRILVWLICALVSAWSGIGTAIAQDAPAAAERPRIAANRNLVAAGTLRSGVLTLQLEIREGDWYPEADTGPSVPVQAFAEPGRPPQISGPMIRVRAGTEVRASVRNALEKGVARVYGLHDRPGGTQGAMELPAGEVREVGFKLTAPGTYHYWATTTGAGMDGRFNLDSQLSGALIVDALGAKRDDRVLVLGMWLERGRPPLTQPGKQFAVINGKAWPHNERLTYDLGQDILWRVINPSFFHHPMHLHGAYFRVTGEGDGAVENALPFDKQRLVVTEFFSPGETRNIEPKIERAGRWLFHCHLLAHMSPEYRVLAPTPIGNFLPHEGVHHVEQDASGMWGMVLGVTVRPSGRASLAAASTEAARPLTLHVRERPATARFPGAFVFQIQDGARAPALESATVPGPPLILTQGQPVEITVHNQLREPTAIHWHGIQLDSYYDGVPGWGGAGDRVAPPIEPGESFVARFAPPRAGTFMYHTHWHNFLQLVGGLYGPLIVLPPGQKFDAETDKIVMISLGGVLDRLSPLLVNGSAQPEPMQLKTGVKYRLRFINILPLTRAMVALVENGVPVRWRALAKDGANLPAAQALEHEARQTLGVGEIYDFEFQPVAKGDLRLEVQRPNRTLTVMEVQVR
jgi:FtsP/CotA-like multicopper oxidase with cupredoxin domain